MSARAQQQSREYSHGSVLVRPIVHINDRFIASSSANAPNKGGAAAIQTGLGKAAFPFSATSGSSARAAIGFKVAPQTLFAPFVQVGTGPFYPMCGPRGIRSIAVLPRPDEFPRRPIAALFAASRKEGPAFMKGTR